MSSAVQPKPPSGESESIMSSYIAIIGILLIVLLPLVIPTVITIVHALENLRRNHRLINRGADLRDPVRAAA